MAGDTVTRSRLASGDVDQFASAGIVATTAVVVGCRCRADQGVVVTATAIGSRHGNDITVIRRTGVQCPPGVSMTGGAVTAHGKGFAAGAADQGSSGSVVAA